MTWFAYLGFGLIIGGLTARTGFRIWVAVVLVVVAMVPAILWSAPGIFYHEKHAAAPAVWTVEGGVDKLMKPGVHRIMDADTASFTLWTFKGRGPGNDTLYNYIAGGGVTFTP